MLQYKLKNHLDNMYDPENTQQMNFLVDKMMDETLSELSRRGHEFTDVAKEELRNDLVQIYKKTVVDIFPKYKPYLYHIASIIDGAKKDKYKHNLGDNLASISAKLDGEIINALWNTFLAWQDRHKDLFPVNNSHAARIAHSFFLGGQLRKDKVQKIMNYSVSDDGEETIIDRLTRDKVYIKKITLKHGGKYYSNFDSQLEVKFLEDGFSIDALNELLANTYGIEGYRVWVGLLKKTHDLGAGSLKPIITETVDFNRDYLGYTQPSNPQYIKSTSQILNTLRSSSIVIYFEDQQKTPQVLELSLLHIDWSISTKNEETHLSDNVVLSIPQAGKVIKKFSYHIPYDLFHALSESKQFYLADERVLKEIEHNKYPYAMKIYFIVMQQFRLDPGKEEKSWTTENLFKLLTIDLETRNINVLQMYQRIKKDCEYLVEKFFIKDFRIDNSGGTLLEHKWYFQQMDSDKGRNLNIYEKRLEYIEAKRKEKEHRLTAEDIKNIIEESELSAYMFASEINYSKADLSKVLNGKRGVSKGLHNKITKWLERREQIRRLK